MNRVQGSNMSDSQDENVQSHPAIEVVEVETQANSIGRPTKYKPEYCEQLIEHMSGGLSYECFGAIINVARSTIYKWETEFPEFSDAKELAFNQSLLYWEKAGNAGMYMGGKDNPFNATIWNINMKNRFGWKDKVETTHQVTDEVKKLVIDMGD